MVRVRGHNSWGMNLLCSRPRWLRIKATFLFPPNSALFIWHWLSEKAKILASYIFTCTVLFFLLVSTLFASHFSVFVEILLGKAKGTGPLAMTTGPVLRSGALTTTIRPQSLAGNPNPALSHCGPRSLMVMTTCAVFFFAKLPYNLALLLASSEQFEKNFRVTWNAVYQAWSPKNSHWIKHVLTFKLWVLSPQYRKIIAWYP